MAGLYDFDPDAQVVDDLALGHDDPDFSLTPSSSGQATITGSGVVAATGAHIAIGSATITGSGTISAAGVPKVLGSATITGSGTISAAGTPKVLGSATLTGSGVLAAAGVVVVAGGATLSGSGTINADGDVASEADPCAFDAAVPFDDPDTFFDCEPGTPDVVVEEVSRPGGRYPDYSEENAQRRVWDDDEVLMLV